MKVLQAERNGEDRVDVVMGSIYTQLFQISYYLPVIEDLPILQTHFGELHHL
jgi:hypothetical protein